MVFGELVLYGKSGSPRAGGTSIRLSCRWLSSGSRSGGAAGGAGTGGDGAIPVLPGGDDGVQPAQQRGSARGAGLSRGEAAVLAGGQLGELGCQDGVAA